MSPSNESSSKLSACVERGTAWHHSSLTASEKHLVEKGYRGGDLFALFATSTLAVGVTLPARRVVIRSPVVGAEALDPASFRQMIGRAGRSGTLRNEQQMGEVFILGVDECAKQIGTSKEAQLEFLEVLLGPVPAIQSCLSDQRLVRLTLELLTIGLWRSSAHLYQALFRDSLWGVQQEDALISVKDRQRSIVERVDRCVKYLQAHSMIRGFNERWSVYQSAFRSPIVLIRFFLHLISPPGLNETANNSVDVSRDPSIIFFPKQYRIFNTCIAPHLKESAGSGPKGSTFDEIVQSLSDSSDSLRIPHNASRQEDAPSDPRSMPIRWTSIAYACVEASLHPAKALEITADLLKASLMGVHTTRDIHLLFIVMDCSYHFPVKWDKLDSFLKFLSNGSTASTDLYKKQTRQHLPPVAERLGDSAVGETEALLRRNIDMYLGGKSLDLSHGPLAPKDPEHHDRILPLMKALGISATWVAYIVRTPMLDKIKNWNLVQYHDRLLHGDVRLDVLLTLSLVSNHKRFYMAMVMSDFLVSDRPLRLTAPQGDGPHTALPRRQVLRAGQCHLSAQDEYDTQLWLHQHVREEGGHERPERDAQGRGRAAGLHARRHGAPSALPAAAGGRHGLRLPRGGLLLRRGGLRAETGRDLDQRHLPDHDELRPPQQQSGERGARLGRDPPEALGDGRGHPKVFPWDHHGRARVRDVEYPPTFPRGGGWAR
eukprot:GHVH01017248.1.p1 GENE.GHVH01017248.1~~GHVH01017248.1.p1  ORF type:complete len:714 (+),score=110.59 GHVH01017248.1:1831-3972(+)